MADKFWNDKKKEGGSDISNTEWGMVISLLGIVDLIQIILNLALQIGVIVNRFIDIAVGLAWLTYLYLRGVNLKSVKTVGSIILTFFLEEIPDVDALPLWVADGVFVFSVTKAEKELEKAAAVGVAVAAVAAAPETGGASLAAGEAAEGGLAAAEAGAAAGEGAGVAEGAEALESAGGPGISDEYADAMGQENESRGEGGPADTGEKKGEGDADREIQDEEADELGKESDNKARERENETPEDRARREEEEAKKKGKGGERQKPQAREEGFGLGVSQGGGVGSNPLNLRGGADEKRQAEKEFARLHSNLLDLSLSYGERKKQREDEETSFSE